jgi:hypothetical protein
MKSEDGLLGAFVLAIGGGILFEALYDLLQCIVDDMVLQAWAL